MAVRWVRFLLGIELRRQGRGGKTIAKRLGMPDPASWTRFVQRLIGRSPKQLPDLPIEDWARVGVARVYLVSLPVGSLLPEDESEDDASDPEE